MKRNLGLLFFVCLSVVVNAIDVVSRTISVVDEKVVISAYNDNGKVEFYEKIGNDYVAISVINSIVSNGGEIMSPFISFDGRQLYFSAKYQGKTNFDIYYSSYDGVAWSMPKCLSVTLNSMFDELYPSISPQGTEIYFVRRQVDRSTKTPIEENSLYIATKDLKGKWDMPKKIIISNNKDLFPIILPDGETLVFLSMREVGGKMSKNPLLFYTKRLINDNWLDPKPIYIDDKYDLLYPYYKDNAICYFTKENKKSLFIEKRVDFKVEQTLKVLVTGKVLEENKVVDAKISVFDNLTNQPILFSQAYKDGWFALSLPKGRDYLIDFYANGYTHYFHRVYTSDLNDNSDLSLDVQLSKTLNLTFSVYDKLLYSPIEAKMKITDMNNRLYPQLKPQKIGDNRYNIVLPLGRDYKLFVEQNGYQSHCFEISKEKPIQFNVSELDVELLPNMKNIVLRVVDVETKQLLENVSIDLQNQGLEEEILLNLPIGIIDTTLRENDRYQARIMAPGYIYKIDEFNMSQILDKDTFILELLPIKTGVVVQLQNVNFAYNSAELLEESVSALNDIVDFMLSNPDVRILLAAHTDDVGRANYNIKLSQKRAETVKTYLIKQGIKLDRLESEGFGMQEPLVPNDSEENRAKNRRVEFRIL